MGSLTACAHPRPSTQRKRVMDGSKVAPYLPPSATEMVHSSTGVSCAVRWTIHRGAGRNVSGSGCLGAANSKQADGRHRCRKEGNQSAATHGPTSGAQVQRRPNRVRRR